MGFRDVTDWLKGQNFTHLSLLSSILNGDIFCVKEKSFYVEMLLHHSIQRVESFVLAEKTTFLIVPELLSTWEEGYSRSWGKNLSLIWAYICKLHPLAIRLYGPLLLQLQLSKLILQWAAILQTNLRSFLMCQYAAINKNSCCKTHFFIESSREAPRITATRDLPQALRISSPSCYC